MRLDHIQATRRGCSGSGICIGLSTYADVVGLYGPIPKEWKNERYLDFEAKGVAFSFDEAGVVDAIEVFPVR